MYYDNKGRYIGDQPGKTSLKVPKKPPEKDKKGKDKKKVDARKWLRIGSALAQLGGGTDHAAELAKEYDPTESQGNKGYENLDEGKKNGKKKKKNNGY